MQADGLTVIYKEVEEAVKYYARAKNLEMVLHINELGGADAYSPRAIQDHLRNNACIPIYMHPELDITPQITQMLNQRMEASAAPAQPIQQPPQR
jgi:hypothetical protein